MIIFLQKNRKDRACQCGSKILKKGVGGWTKPAASQRRNQRNNLLRGLPSRDEDPVAVARDPATREIGSSISNPENELGG